MPFFPHRSHLISLSLSLSLSTRASTAKREHPISSSSNSTENGRAEKQNECAAVPKKSFYLDLFLSFIHSFLIYIITHS